MSYTQRQESGHIPLVDTTPDGYLCAKVRDFIVLAKSADPYTIQWSAIGDPTDWPTPATDDARSKQSGAQTFSNDYGIVTGIAGDDFFAYVFQEAAVTKMTYVGGDIVFAFDTFEEGRGCFEIGRFAQTDDTVFFESEFAYHALTNGQIADIGLGVVDDTYPPQRVAVSWATEPKAMQAVAVNRAINCAFFESQNLCYNYKTGQWSRLPALDGRGYFSLDSETGVIGQSVVSSSSGYIQNSEGGTAQTATITTGETDINQGGRALIDAVRPLVNGGTVTSRVGVRDALSDSVTWCTGTSVNTRTGKIHYRNAATPPEGRYQRVEFTIADGFTTALGADIDYEPTGKV